MRVRIPGFVVDDNGHEVPCEVLLDVEGTSMLGAQLNGTLTNDIGTFACTIPSDSRFEPRRGWREDYERSRMRSVPQTANEQEKERT